MTFILPFVPKDQQELESQILRAKRGSQKAKEYLKTKHKLKVWTDLELKGLNIYLKHRNDTPHWEPLKFGKAIRINDEVMFTPVLYRHLEDIFYIIVGTTDLDPKPESYVFAMRGDIMVPLFSTSYWVQWDFPKREDIMIKEYRR